LPALDLVAAVWTVKEMASAEDIAAIVAAVLKEMRKSEGLQGGQGSRKRLDERHFRRVEKFTGCEKVWRDWHFQVRAAVRAADKQAAEIMEHVERTEEDMTSGDIEDKYMEDDGDSKIEKLAAEMYDLLCSLTSGEAMTVVRAETEMNGFLAWRSLCKRYSPMTPARTLAALMDVMNPPKHTDINLILKAIDLWTLKINTLEKDHGEKLSPNMKKAVLLSMLPNDIQDLIYQNAEATKTYEETRDRVKAVVNNRLARSSKGGSPMDIGQIDKKEEDWDKEVYAVGKGACHSCGEHGHFAKDCPKGKGKGKSGKGTFRGECWVCGEHGHSWRFCSKNAKGKGKDGRKGGAQGYFDSYGKGGIYKGKGKGDFEMYGKGGKGGGWSRPAWAVGYETDCEYPEVEWFWDNGEADENAKDNQIGEVSVPDMMQEDLQGEWCKVGGKKKGKWRPPGLYCIDRGGRELEVNEVSHGWERVKVQVDSGAIDTVAPKSVAQAFSLMKTTMSESGVGFVAANGSKIENYGERRVVGYTDEGEAVGMRMTCADVQKVLGSVHRMNMGGNKVVLDGGRSYMENRETGKRTKIHYEGGQYIMYMWVPAKKGLASKVEKDSRSANNRFAILASDVEEPGFPRPGRK
jgi:hypothetical protein